MMRWKQQQRNGWQAPIPLMVSKDERDFSAHRKKASSAARLFKRRFKAARRQQNFMRLFESHVAANRTEQRI